jgi:hypothetical protein
MRPWEARIWDVYNNLKGSALWADSSLESQIQRLLAIYTDAHMIRAESILADDAHAVVLTSESRAGDVEPKHWHATHVWRYSQARVESLDVYVLTLSVSIPT